MKPGESSKSVQGIIMFDISDRVSTAVGQSIAKSRNAVEHHIF